MNIEGKTIPREGRVKSMRPVYAWDGQETATWAVWPRWGWRGGRELWVLRGDQVRHATVSLYSGAEGMVGSAGKVFWCFIMVLLRCNSQTIQLTHLKCIIWWLLLYSQSCATITTLDSRTIHDAKKKPQTP